MLLLLDDPSSRNASPCLLRQGFRRLPFSTPLRSWLSRSGSHSASLFSEAIFTAAVAAQIHAWFRALDGGDLADKVVCMAWQYRGVSPVITVTTSPSDVDERSPALTMTPLSAWEAEKSTFAELFPALLPSLKKEGDVSDNNSYLVIFNLRHTDGEESGLCLLSEMSFFPEEYRVDMDRLTIKDLNLRGIKTKTDDSTMASYLEESAFVTTIEDPELAAKYADVPHLNAAISHAYTITNVKGPVRLVGLKGEQAARLNGQEVRVLGVDLEDDTKFVVLLTETQESIHRSTTTLSYDLPHNKVTRRW
jgi:hypothetical protein